MTKVDLDEVGGILLGEGRTEEVSLVTGFDFFLQCLTLRKEADSIMGEERASKAEEDSLILSFCFFRQCLTLVANIDLFEVGGIFLLARIILFCIFLEAWRVLLLSKANPVLPDVDEVP